MQTYKLPPVLIKGAGEHATGTAHRLFRAGFPVVMTEIAAPTCVRRLVSFASVIWESRFTVEDVEARLVEELPEDLTNLEYIPVLIMENTTAILPRFPIVVDARIAKTNLDNQLTDAELVIGLGPGLTAGVDVHLVIETNRGHNLGRLLFTGQAEPDTGIPGTIAGESGTRVLRAPAAGVFHEILPLGSMVDTDDIIADVEGIPVKTAISGIIRGLIQHGTIVSENLKIGDVDPRGEPDSCRTLSDKTRTLSGTVLEAICHFLTTKKPA